MLRNYFASGNIEVQKFNLFYTQYHLYLFISSLYIMRRLKLNSSFDVRWSLFLSSGMITDELLLFSPLLAFTCHFIPSPHLLFSHWIYSIFFWFCIYVLLLVFIHKLSYAVSEIKIEMATYEASILFSLLYHQSSS